jgi:hypothetical protein
MNNNTKRECNEVLHMLGELSRRAEWDNLPADILEAIGFCSYTNSGVSVTLGSSQRGLSFVFEMSVPYERSEQMSISIDDQLFDRYVPGGES